MTKADFTYWYDKFQNVLQILEEKNPKSANHLRQFTVINQIKHTVSYTGDNISIARCYLPSSAFRRHRSCSPRLKEICRF